MSGDDELQRTYDRIAADFAALNAAMPPNLADLAHQLAQHVGTDGLILDVGCGPGRDTAWLERTQRRVIGLDLSFQMLQQAQRITHGRQAQMNMKALGIPTSSADGLWCCAALLHLPKAQAPLALAEFRRVLRSAGLLIVSVQQGAYDGPRHSNQLGVTRHFADYHPDELAALVSAAGFAVQSQRSSPGSVQGVWLQTVALAH